MKIVFYFLTVPIRILMTIFVIVLVYFFSILAFITNEFDILWETSNDNFQSIWKY